MIMGKRIGKGRESGFTLIELLIVILIIGILAAVAGPLYIGYTKDAKLGEAKALAGLVWTTLQALAQQNCGVNQALSGTYSRAGLDPLTGATNPVRWTVTPAIATLSATCANGTYALGGGPIAVTGTVADVNTLIVNLTWTAGATPPTVLTCSTNGPGAANFSPC